MIYYLIIDRHYLKFLDEDLSIKIEIKMKEILVKTYRFAMNFYNNFQCIFIVKIISNAFL